MFMGCNVNLDDSAVSVFCSEGCEDNIRGRCRLRVGCGPRNVGVPWENGCSENNALFLPSYKNVIR